MSKLSILKNVALLSDDKKLARIQEILAESAEVKLEQMKLDDGETVIEAEMFEAGQPVNVVTEDGQLIPLPVNDPATPYVLEDGRTLSVEEEGIISAINEPAAEGEVEEEEPVAASDKPTQAPLPKSIIESVSKETKFSSDLEKKVEELEALVLELTKQNGEVELNEEPVKPIVHNPDRAPQSINPAVKRNDGMDKFFNIFN